MPGQIKPQTPLLPVVGTSHVYCMLGCYVVPTVLLVPKLQALVYDILPLEEQVPESEARSVISTQTFRRRALTASVDSCADIKSAPGVA